MQTKLKMITSLLVISILASTTTRAETSCKDVIDAADKTIEQKNKVIDQADKTLAKSQEYNAMLRDQVTELEGSRNAWYNNPYLYFAIGLVGGVVLVNKTK